MKESSIYNFFQQKFNEAAIQQNYNMAAFTESYRTDGFNEREVENLKYRIECNATELRLIGNEVEIPDNIERCK